MLYYDLFTLNGLTFNLKFDFIKFQQFVSAKEISLLIFREPSPYLIKLPDSNDYLRFIYIFVHLII